MQDYSGPKETIITMEEVSVGSTMKKTFFSLAVFLVLAVGYHILFVLPLFDRLQVEARLYYVVSMDTLLDAKVADLLRQRERSGVEKSEAEIDADMKNFVEGLRDKLLELSGGYPIFSTSSVVSAKSGIVDLTDEILAQFSLAVDPAFDQFLKKP